MATIISMPPQQQQSSIQQQQFQTQSAPPAQDPLFEALVRYITQGPKSSSISASEVQSIIDSHVAQDGGRAYLESIVMPEPDPIRIYEHMYEAMGSLNTMPGTFGLRFMARQGGMSLQVIHFSGSGSGFFPTEVVDFKDAKFYWNETLRGHKRVTFTARVKAGEIIIDFRPEVEQTIYPPPPLLAELVISGSAVLPPDGARGQGDMIVAD